MEGQINLSDLMRIALKRFKETDKTRLVIIILSILCVYLFTFYRIEKAHRKVMVQDVEARFSLLRAEVNLEKAYLLLGFDSLILNLKNINCWMEAEVQNSNLREVMDYYKIIGNGGIKNVSPKCKSK